jgi:hypothetical protein
MEGDFAPSGLNRRIVRHAARSGTSSFVPHLMFEEEFRRNDPPSLRELGARKKSRGQPRNHLNPARRVPFPEPVVIPGANGPEPSILHDSICSRRQAPHQAAAAGQALPQTPLV